MGMGIQLIQLSELWKLAGGAKTILKNDGVRQWEGLSLIIPYINIYDGK